MLYCHEEIIKNLKDGELFVRLGTLFQGLFSKKNFEISLFINCLNGPICQYSMLALQNNSTHFWNTSKNGLHDPKIYFVPANNMFEVRYNKLEGTGAYGPLLLAPAEGLGGIIN